MKKDEILSILDRTYFSDHSDEQVIIEALPSLRLGVRHFVDVGASLGQFTFHANRPATHAVQFQRLARRGMRAARRFSGLC